jgi:hypothetical protein
MDNPQLAELKLEISASNATTEDIDGMTRELLSELRELEVESAELAKSGLVTSGAKSADAVTTGVIALTVLPAVLPKLVDFIQAWALRGQGRTVKFKGKVSGQAIEFEGSGEELQKLLATLKKARRK